MFLLTKESNEREDFVSWGVSYFNTLLAVARLPGCKKIQGKTSELKYSGDHYNLTNLRTANLYNKVVISKSKKL